MLEINFENQILALFWPFNKSHEKFNTIFVISAIITSIWNVFIKFRWHDEKLTTVLTWITLMYNVDLALGVNLAFFWDISIEYLAFSNLLGALKMYVLYQALPFPSSLNLQRKIDERFILNHFYGAIEGGSYAIWILRERRPTIR